MDPDLLMQIKKALSSMSRPNPSLLRSYEAAKDFDMGPVENLKKAKNAGNYIRSKVTGKEDGGDNKQGGGGNREAELPYKYDHRYSIRHNILKMVGHECPPAVKIMLIHALRDYDHFCNKSDKTRCSSCHSEVELINMGAHRWPNRWTIHYMSCRVVEPFGKCRHCGMTRSCDFCQSTNIVRPRKTALLNLYFRNNDDLSKPALVFECFERLPAELRLKIWNRSICKEDAYVVTLDAATQRAIKNDQVLPDSSADSACEKYFAFSNNVIQFVNTESRQVILENLHTHIYINATTSPSQTSIKLMLNTKRGDLVFINKLKICFASLTAPGLRSGMTDSFPNNITTLAIHEGNFYPCSIPGVDQNAEFAKIANILRKFKTLEKLYIMVGYSDKQWNFKLVSELEETEPKKIMGWSVQAIEVSSFRAMVARYAENTPEWKVPQINFLHHKTIKPDVSSRCYSDLLEHRINSRGP